MAIKNRKILSFFPIIIAAAIFCIPFSTKAATLYIDPPTSVHAPGDTFLAKIKVNPEVECINAGEIGMRYGDILELVDFSVGNSIFSLWVDRPEKNKVKKVGTENVVSFSGGIPGGFCGMITGDIGESNIIAEAVFKIKENAADFGNNGQIALVPESMLLLNDGKGTAAKITLQSATVEIRAGATSTSDEWKERTVKDDIPPEQFIIEIEQDPNMFDNKYYIVFSTVDKQTGLDHFEVEEVAPEFYLPQNWKDKLRNYFQKAPQEPKWEKANTPYLLQDQSLKSKIMVKAVDKAGNERIVEYVPHSIAASGFPMSWISLLTLIISLIIAIILLLVIRNKTRK